MDDCGGEEELYSGIGGRMRGTLEWETSPLIYDVSGKVRATVLSKEGGTSVYRPRVPRMRGEGECKRRGEWGKRSSRYAVYIFRSIFQVCDYEQRESKQSRNELIAVRLEAACTG